MLKGTLLAESLRTGAELRVAGLNLTRLSRQDFSASALPTQPPVWTVVGFEGDDDVADRLAQSLSESLLAGSGWYADFKTSQEQVVVFAGRIFRYQRGDRAGRAEAVAYGISVGVPEGQLDWPD
jgi:hypothetical protein